MDIIAINDHSVPILIDTCFTYSSKKLYLGTLTFNLPSCSIKTRLLRLKIKDRFNFLVKGKDADHTAMLSDIDFNMFFGDLDIV